MYDFKNAPHRKNQGCTKWDKADALYGCGVAENLLPMWIADMDFAVAPPIVAALQKRVQNLVFGYDFLTDEYYEAVVGWMKRRHNYEIQKEWITFTPGIVTALHMAVNSVTEPGDEVLMCSPVYGPFFGATTDEGRVLLDVPLHDEDGYYTMDWDAMEKAVTPKTRAMLLCSPHNPGGRVWTREELEKLDACCEKHNIFVIADEIHNDLVFSGEHIVYGNVSEHAKMNCIICTAPSKTFNLAGIQGSNILIANEEVRKKFQAQVAKAHASANIFAGPATIAAYNEGEEWLGQMLDYVHGNMEFTVRFLAEHLPEIRTAIPEGTYLMWLDLRGLGLGHEELLRFMAREAGVGLNDGAAFGVQGRGFMRMNMATSRTLIKTALLQIEAAWQSRENRH